MVKIRLRRVGAKKLLSIVLLLLTAALPATAASSKEIGTNDPNQEPSVVKIDAEKAKQWMANGAQPTDTVRVLLKKSNIL